MARRTVTVPPMKAALPVVVREADALPGDPVDVRGRVLPEVVGAAGACFRIGRVRTSRIGGPLHEGRPDPIHGLYQIGEVKARSCSSMVVPGKGLVLK